MGIPSQSLRGLVAQGMDGRKKGFTGYTYQYPPGSYTFNAPAAGYWKFVLWGPGGPGDVSNNGGSGAYCEYTKFLGVNEAVTLVAGAHATTDTTATFANGTVVTAGRGAANTAGTASGGDVNLNGSLPGVAGLGTGGGAAGASTGGGGAPANLPFRGGAGAAGGTGQAGRSPGAGGQYNSGAYEGGSSLILAYLVRT